MAAKARFHIPELDGLRGVAILLVMACHFSGAVMVESHHNSLLLYLFRLGWSGVDLFFVLSGFLITSILVSAKSEPNYFSSFYWRRALRIFPLYFVFLAVFFAVQKVSLKESLWYWFYLANWRNTFVPGIGLLRHFWSLSVEEQFYLMWPFAVFVTPVRRLWLLTSGVCLAGFAISLACESAGLGEVGLLTLTPFRMGTLAFGGLLAVSSTKLKNVLPILLTLSVVSFIGLVWLWAGVKDRVPPFATVTYICTATVFAGMVAECIVSSGSHELLPLLMRNPVLRSFGKYSYAMYVFHPVIMALSSHRVWLYLNARVPLAVAAASHIFIMVGLSYAAATLSWHILERHFLALKERNTRVAGRQTGASTITAIALGVRGKRL